MIYEKEYFVACFGHAQVVRVGSRHAEASQQGSLRSCPACGRPGLARRKVRKLRRELSLLSAGAREPQRRVASGFHAKLKTWKLSVPEYRVLLCLAGADGLGVGDLAAMAIMAQPRMTKVLDRMERQGLLGRHPDKSDRRRVFIHLTASGRARAAPVLRAAKAHEARLLAPFSAEERAVIKRALDLLINGRT
jgi:DNA-binding MarR family transcriptional regulator